MSDLYIQHIPDLQVFRVEKREEKDQQNKVLATCYSWFKPSICRVCDLVTTSSILQYGIFPIFSGLLLGINDIAYVKASSTVPSV